MTGWDLDFWSNHYTTLFIREWCQQGHWVDLGCGPSQADWYVVTNNSAVNILGVDFSPVALEQARTLSPVEGLEWLCADFRQPLPLDASTFDGCICSHTLEHVEDTEALFSEITRIVKPGGRLIVIVPHLYSHDSETHCWHFSQDQLSEVLVEYGVIEHLEITPDNDQIGAIVRLPDENDDN